MHILPFSRLSDPRPHGFAGIATLALTAIMALAAPSRAQDQAQGLLDPSRFALGLNYTGISYHPGGGENEEHYKRSLDDKDYWVWLLGFQANADYKLHRYFYVRTATSLYRDCADLWAGYYHLGFRANYDFTDRFSMRIGIGPTYLWRQNWAGKVKGYEKDSFFGDATGGGFQGKLIFYGGDAEAEWKAWDRVSLVYAIIPGWPEVIQNSVGMRLTF
jgi:hypothetical protein